MDFPVEATVHLSHFQDKREVLEILRSHGFMTNHISQSQVLVKGLFSELRAAKAHLEQLLKAQKQTSVHSSSHCPDSSGAIPKTHYNSTSASDGYRSRSGSRNKLSHASASSPNNSASPGSGTSQHHPPPPLYRASFRPDQRASVRHQNEIFAVEADVFRYAEQVKKTDMSDILVRYNVRLRVDEVGESIRITLEGKRAGVAAGELQSLLNYLTTSLRIQEVPRKDMSHKGKVVLQRIRENKKMYFPVLVFEMNDRLRLIGPSAESYELKQWLLRENSRKRSSSLQAVSRRKAGRDGGAAAKPSPVRAADHSPSKLDDGKQDDDDEPEPLRRRSESVSYENRTAQAESANGHLPKKESKQKPIKTMKKMFKRLFNR